MESLTFPSFDLEGDFDLDLFFFFDFDLAGDLDFDLYLLDLLFDGDLSRLWYLGGGGGGNRNGDLKEYIEYEIKAPNLSRDSRKPVFGVFNQV